ncbi:MAG: WYL domain-containing protein [Burkholderiaceae bacterium]|nr:WYL domain-containing protein [Burkholderiaceae bacterium]
MGWTGAGAGRALAERRLVALGYRDGAGATTKCRVRPLGLSFWGDRWSLAAWCELRQDFRNFRLDRVVTLDVLEEGIVDGAGCRIEHFLRRVQSE